MKAEVGAVGLVDQKEAAMGVNELGVRTKVEDVASVARSGEEDGLWRMVNKRFFEPLEAGRSPCAGRRGTWRQVHRRGAGEDQAAQGAHVGVAGQ